ncbi:helix-turn-helix domain-containing protein [Aliarcobacter cibarius]|uniref:Helix-turn-helix domain-containing protein n=1 Tax=Aliarcobacter cibarius TaxID=255507 RepID=A0A7L5JMR9_9BACT|nr:helix-turn-helix domain-containing protein [Aliarcobacter cibarius]QKJ26533.1 helix-turn-helix domain-containing protein [Aliarcobacter cibarius]
MSIKAINEAFKSNLNGNIKLVLLALADCADDSMSCFPSYSHIAKKASISISTAKRIVKKLEKMQVLKKQHRFKKGKKQQTSNIYTLTFGGSTLTPLKVQNDTTIVSSVTPQDSVTAMTYESSSSLIITQSSVESERDFLDFKNGIVRDFQNKTFAAISEKHIYSICDGLLCINYQKLDKQKAFQEWKYLFINQHLINGKLAENINFINIGKFIKVADAYYKIIDIQNNFYVINVNGSKKCIKICDAEVVNG